MVGLRVGNLCWNLFGPGQLNEQSVVLRAKHGQECKMLSNATLAASQSIAGMLLAALFTVGRIRFSLISSLEACQIDECSVIFTRRIGFDPAVEHLMCPVQLMEPVSSEARVPVVVLQVPWH